jgi:2-keto-4-pentenoate hydratase/2-oxohepta-3-ene-1,7-dioic acid hydratase in catechol pathway
MFQENGMKIARVQKDGEVFYAALDKGVFKRIAGLPYDGIQFTGETYASDSVTLLAPAEPSKVVAVGLNYAKHAGEMKEALPENPILFIKPSTAVLAPGGAIVYPKAAGRVDYEAELGVVIAKTCKGVSAEAAKEYIFGYTALNDVTARDLQKKDGQWTRAKGFDTFCPFGPYVDTDYDPRGRQVQSVLSGEVKQDGTTADMIYDVYSLVAFISSVMTLLPGDVIATGTPEGIGPMQRGDTIEIKVAGLEPLVNTVR